MKRFLGGCLVLAALAFACDNDGPTQPTPPPPTSPPVANPPPAPPPTTPPPPTAPTDRWSKDAFEMDVLKNDGEAFRVEATNVTDEDIRLRLSCYEGPPNDPPSQSFFSPGGNHSVGPGSTAVFECPVACGQGQADLHEGPMLDPPVGYGRNLTLGRATRGYGARCTVEPPPPPPPVCDVGALRTSARQECGELGFELNVDACTFTCDQPPQCDPYKLRRQAEANCKYGVKSVDLDACTWECKPKPKCDDDDNSEEGFGSKSDDDDDCDDDDSSEG